MGQIVTSLRFGMGLTAVGGFLDVYSYLGRGGVFAGAQSGNVVLLGVNIANRDVHGALVLVAPIIAFMSGSACAAWLGQLHQFPIIDSPIYAILLCEIALLAIVGIVPDTAADIPMSMLVSFAAAIQVATFRKVRNWSFTTTITTNNLVTAVTSLVKSISRHDSVSPRAGIGLFLYRWFLPDRSDRGRSRNTGVWGRCSPHRRRDSRLLARLARCGRMIRSPRRRTRCPGSPDFESHSACTTCNHPEVNRHVYCVPL